MIMTFFCDDDSRVTADMSKKYILYQSSSAGQCWSGHKKYYIGIIKK